MVNQEEETGLADISFNPSARNQKEIMSKDILLERFKSTVFYLFPDLPIGHVSIGISPNLQTDELEIYLFFKCWIPNKQSHFDITLTRRTWSFACTLSNLILIDNPEEVNNQIKILEQRIILELQNIRAVFNQYNFPPQKAKSFVLARTGISTIIIPKGTP